MKSIAQIAQSLVYGDRRKSYDHPARNFKRIADAWTWWIQSKYGKKWRGRFDLEDVAALNMLQKLARLAFGFKRDSLVDVDGYAETWDIVHTFKEKMKRRAPWKK